MERHIDFNVFKHAVAKQFAAMVEKDHYLFETSVDKDTMWELYLQAFPEGTNEIFRVRREYDCSCCRQFIRAIGGVVSIDPATFKINSIWDIDIPEEPVFQAVATAMRNMIHTVGEIERPYFNETWQVSTDRTFEKVLDRSDPSITKAPLEFTHFSEAVSGSKNCTMIIQSLRLVFHSPKSVGETNEHTSN